MQLKKLAQVNVNRGFIVYYIVIIYAKFSRLDRIVSGSGHYANSTYLLFGVRKDYVFWTASYQIDVALIS